MLEVMVAAGIAVSLVVYALMGGADFGGGVWDLVATGPHAARQRRAIAAAIGPIWEANHVWLILVVVLMFTGFPTAFSAMMTALNVPLTLMLFGIVVRGAAFVFREYGGDPAAVRRGWGRMFGMACVLTPLVQGATLAALVSGDIRVVDGQVTTGFLAGWLTPFACGCGVFALTLFAFLAATYLTVDTRHDAELQGDFRRRALWSGVLLVPIAFGVLLAAGRGAPVLTRSATSWWTPWLLGCTGLCTVTALAALMWRRFHLARAAAIGQVTLILTGWMLAQFPNLVAPDVTVWSARAPDVTLRLLLIALATGGAVLLPSLWVLFRLFKSEKRDVYMSSRATAT